MAKKEYPTIDVIKFLCAVFVVAIHTSALSIPGSVPAWLAKSLLLRTGVPFFFVTSGYFLAGKVFSVGYSDRREIKNVLRIYCRRLVPPLILWGG